MSAISAAASAATVTITTGIAGEPLRTHLVEYQPDVPGISDRRTGQ